MLLVFYFLLLLFSGFYSSYETAFYSLEKESKKDKQRVLFVLNVILLGNATVRVLFSEVGGYNLEVLLQSHIGIHGPWNHLFVIFFTTFMLVIFGESIPLNFGIAYSGFVVKSLNWFIKISSFIFWPIVKPLTWMIHSMIESLTRKFQKNKSLTEEEVRSIIQLSYEREVVNPYEKKITDAIINLYSQPVSFYMIPRRDIPIFDMKDTIQYVWESMKAEGLSQIVIQDHSIDNIIGYLVLEDLVLIHNVKDNTQDIESISHKIRSHVVIPDSKKLIDALLMLKTQKRALAIVIDEYGGVDGIITLNHLLGSLLVFDDYTDSHYIGSNMPQGSWMMPYEDGIAVNALRTTLRMVLEYFDQTIPAIQEVEWSIGRLILKKLDRFPKEGEELQIQNLYFRILGVHNYAIERVYITVLEEEFML